MRQWSVVFGRKQSFSYMNDDPKTIGYVLRHGKTRTFKHNRSEAEFLIDDVEVMKRQIDHYRQEFEFDGPPDVVLSSNADRCVQTALLVVAALVPRFDPFPRIQLLEEYAKRAMDAKPDTGSDSWFCTAVRRKLCDENDVIGNFPQGSPVASISITSDLVTSSTLTATTFPTNVVWVAVTHADVVAMLRKRDVAQIRHWTMCGITKLPWYT
jgi:hypothetical protein